MKKNQIITSAIVAGTTIAAGIAVFFYWKRNRNRIIAEVENESQHHHRELPERKPVIKHKVSAFHNAKAAANAKHEVPA